MGGGRVLLFAVHAVLPEAFGEGVGVDLQLCDLKKANIFFAVGKKLHRSCSRLSVDVL